MPLTRHLYREDEVISALIFCILRGRHVEAAFWCSEMIVSEMIDELLGAMRRAWFYGIGIQCLGWLRDFQALGEAIEAERLLELVQQLCRAKKDRSAVTLLSTDLSVQPDRVNAGATTDANSLEQFVQLAVMQRRTTTAWGGLQAMESPEQLLKRLAMSKHGVAGAKALKAILAEPLGVWETRAMALAALCLSREEFVASWTAEPQPLLREVAAGLKEWEPLLGRRRRRIYAIPPESLYYFTERGRTVSVYDTTEKEIMGRLEKTGGLWGSVYWDSIGDWQAVKTDDTVRETFYDTHFPDDRPDEWSKADRAKSHGAGPLQRGAVATLQIAMERLLGRLSSAVIWGRLPPVKNEWTPVDIREWNLTPVVLRVKDFIVD